MPALRIESSALEKSGTGISLTFPEIFTVAVGEVGV